MKVQVKDAYVENCGPVRTDKNGKPYQLLNLHVRGVGNINLFNSDYVGKFQIGSIVPSVDLDLVQDFKTGLFKFQFAR
jgi:hypothetical protein